MKITIIALMIGLAGCAKKVEYKTWDDVWDTCPSLHGNSCPEDGSPCPFCGRIKLIYDDK